MDWKRIIDVEIEKWLLMIMVLAMVLLVFLQVVARYVLNISVGWSSEVSRYLLIWVSWISVSYVIRVQEHIRIKTITDRFNDSMKKVVEIFVNLCWGGFAVVMAIVGTEVALNIKMMGQTTSTLQWPTWILYLILPISGCLIFIRLSQQIYFIFTKDSHESSDT